MLYWGLGPAIKSCQSCRTLELGLIAIDIIYTYYAYIILNLYYCQALIYLYINIYPFILNIDKDQMIILIIKYNYNIYINIYT